MYLQINDAAKALGVSRQWLYVLINRGSIGTGDVAGKRFVLDDDRFKAIRKDRVKANLAPKEKA